MKMKTILQKGIISKIRECNSYYRLYLNTDTNYCWYQEFESINNWVIYENPNIIEICCNHGCKSIFKTAPLNRKEIMNKINEINKKK